MIEDCGQIASLHKKSISLLCQNIRSINKNFDSLTTLLERSRTYWDLIILTECWLYNSPPLPSMQEYTSVATNQHRSQNEGVVIFFRSHLQASVSEPLVQDANCLLLKLNNDTVVIAIYRSPAVRNVATFLDSLNELLKSVSYYKNIILTGDININIHETSDDSRATEYLTMLAYHGMLPAHTLPTRHGNSCLDHLILKTRHPAFCFVANTSITDHDTVLLFLENHTKSSYSRQKTRTIRILDHEKIELDLLEADFSPVYTSPDVNEATEFFISTLKQIIVQNSTFKVVSNRKRLSKPWMTPGLLRCLRNRDNLHLKSKKNPDNEILQTTFKRYRNYCSMILKTTKSNYNKEQISNAQNNNKKLWEAIKSVTDTAKVKTHADALLSHANPESSVNEANGYFASIGRTLAENIPAVATVPPQTDVRQACHNSLALLGTDEAELDHLIMNLRSDCAIGSDNISAAFLKKNKNILIPHLTYICNLAFSSGTFPNAFKLAVVHPIHKGGDRNRLNNYRPISILPTLSKLLERLMNNRLVKFLNQNHILSSSQYGFRSGISTNNAVLDLTNTIVTKLDEKQKVIGVFLDLAKAFDTISVPTLIAKLERIGIRGTQLSLFSSYLTGRRQCLRIGDWTSDELPITFGVPQGSIIGPTLFLIYINDLCQLKLPNASIFTYADDTALIFSGDSWDLVFQYAQSGLAIVTSWLAQNLLTLNVAKTNYLTFSFSAAGKPSSSSFALIAHSCISTHNIGCDCPHLNRVSCIKYLGVQIDDCLTFGTHIDTLTTRLRRLIYVLKNLRDVADSKVIKRVYLALCQSLIQYCIVSWGGSGRSHMLKVERAQRALLKVGWKLPYRFPTTDLYKTCKVLTVRKIYILNLLMTTHGHTPYDPSLISQRRKHSVCPYIRTNFASAQRFFRFLSSHVYNNTNKLLNIYPLYKSKCKAKIINWLLDLDYFETENILAVLK
ncbi:hypothetical protein PYW07_002759 [Mythimna separata]|uniref:Reverse transcriptase domain-containing protein n=1 Tax=Mythimna separata TaxID=271217 RepID=A0AAD8DQ66_MYTSE|nr:hypothetical protein PYW07_002759 [Mythimna separata]